jgi:hypothetical protein
MMDEFTEGWAAADEAIKFQLPGYQDLSSGDTDWDRGWNARMIKEKEEGV